MFREQENVKNALSSKINATTMAFCSNLNVSGFRQIGGHIYVTGAVHGLGSWGGGGSSGPRGKR